MGEHERRPPGASNLILIVEDDPDSAEMLTMFLEMEGYRASWLPTAASLLRYFADAAAPTSPVPLADTNPHPALILLDLTLPDMDAATLLERLTAAVQPLPPIIIMSAIRGEAVQAAADELGAAGAASKPFDLDSLLRRIEAVLAPA